ncbi:MAG: DUF1385 domain-containing protein, partial [Clostridia bacterium]|nr:DUF1385 domain-containing protein [Clostridia bacterium]
MKEEQSDTATKDGAPEETACTDEAVCAGEEATLQEAEVSLEKTETETTGAQPAEETEKKEPKKEKEEKEKGSSTGALFAGAAVIGTVLGIVLAAGLFFFLPTQIYSWTLQGTVEQISVPYLQMLCRSLFEGLIRIALFVLYMAAVSLMKDIKRTFMYHGAEHKTIFCYEKGLPLTVENVRKMRRFHPR